MTKKAVAEGRYIAGRECMSRKEWQSAMQHFERAADLFTEIYSDDHVLTQESRAHALFCHGGLYQNQLDNDRALDYYEQSERLFADTVGDKHEFTIAARQAYDSAS